MGSGAIVPIRFGQQQMDWTFEILDRKGNVVKRQEMLFNPDEIETAIDKFEDIVAQENGDTILSTENVVEQLREQAESLIRAIDSELLPFKINKHGDDLNKIIDLIKAFEFRYASRYRRAV